MRLLLTVAGPGREPADVAVTVATTTTVSELAFALLQRMPGGAPMPQGRQTIAVETGRGRVVLDPEIEVLRSPLRSGYWVSLVDAAPGDSIGATRGGTRVRVVSGPDQGKVFVLAGSSAVVGRAANSDVVLTDPLVSARHARIDVGEGVEIEDLNSSNGVVIAGRLVTRARVARGDQVLLGNTLVEIDAVPARQAPSEQQMLGIGPVGFTPSPRVQQRPEPRQFTTPTLPEPASAQSFPRLTLVSPLVLGALLYLMTRNISSLAFVLMSPLLAVGAWWENRTGGRKGHALKLKKFQDAIAALRADVDAEQARERVLLHALYPPLSEVAAAVQNRSALLWSRRRDEPEYLHLRLGAGLRPSVNTVTLGPSGGTEKAAEHTDQLEQLALVTKYIREVPVVVDLAKVGSVGVCGPRADRLGVLRGLVLQLAGLHSPAELVVGAVASRDSARDWDWLRWLPHGNGEFGGVESAVRADTDKAGNALIGELEELIRARLAPGLGERDGAAVLVIVEDDAEADRARLIRLAEEGREAGVHVLWSADRVESVPSACRAYVGVAGGAATVGLVQEGQDVAADVEHLPAEHAEHYARLLAPVLDLSATTDDQGLLPTSVSLVALGRQAEEDIIEARTVVEKWVETAGGAHTPQGSGRSENSSLSAVVGMGVESAVELDLRSHGPHALVGGTTGAGKSEFLQTWILSMAAAHGPNRLTFLFVDYKGQAAFKDLVALPHCVGVVSDLSPHLVQRSLVSLRAELKYREHLFARHGAKDILEMERRRAAEAPPSLVIVVDEFAALVQEVPEFITGVVNVAQRGRSLGLHLILATQRPSGAISADLRANTNLRVALRMNDEMDSVDVLGVPAAAAFDPSIPGRAMARTGPGRLVPFQAAYVGAHTERSDAGASIVVTTLGWGLPRVLRAAKPANPSRSATSAPPDIQRVTAAVVKARAQARLPLPRKPWLPELPAVLDLLHLPAPQAPDVLVFGLGDSPDEQVQPLASFDPEQHGNMAVFGSGGTGKTGLLRALTAAAAVATRRGAPTHVYCIDYGRRGLAPLADLPLVGDVIAEDDVDGQYRLLQLLRAVIATRASRWAEKEVGSLSDYRAATGLAEPRILLLLDGFSGFQDYVEAGDYELLNLLAAVAADGRAVGVHVVVTTDRPRALPGAIDAALQRRVYLRLRGEEDYLAFGLPRDVLTPESPPGRGLGDRLELQIGVLGSDPALSAQTRQLALLTDGLTAAPHIPRLPASLPLTSLPAPAAGQVFVGLSVRDIRPVGVPDRGSVVIAAPGPVRDGFVRTLLAAWNRAGVRHPRLVVGQRSSLSDQVAWESVTDVASWKDEVDPLPAGAGDVLVIDAGGDDMPWGVDKHLGARIGETLGLGGCVVLATSPEKSGSWTSGLNLSPTEASAAYVAGTDSYTAGHILKAQVPPMRKGEDSSGFGYLLVRGTVTVARIATTNQTR